MWGALLAAHGARQRVRRVLHTLVLVRPAAAVPVQGVLVDALEPIGVETRAVVLLPHDVLGEAPTRVDELPAVAQVHTHRAGAPQGTAGSSGQRGPARGPPVPPQAGLPIGAVRDDHID